MGSFSRKATVGKIVIDYMPVINYLDTYAEGNVDSVMGPDTGLPELDIPREMVEGCCSYDTPMVWHCLAAVWRRLPALYLRHLIMPPGPPRWCQTS